MHGICAILQLTIDGMDHTTKQSISNGFVLIAKIVSDEANGAINQFNRLGNDFI